MKLIKRMRRGMRRLRQKREWAAAKSSILNSGWATWSRLPRIDIRFGLKTLIARSRTEAQNNDHAKHFLRLVKNNVMGKDGVRFQARVKNRRGEPDDAVNTAIEESWRDWGKPGICEVSGQLSWRDYQRSAIETVARDGASLTRMFMSWPDNRWKFALQHIDVTLLDVDHNEVLGDDREIIMGIEVNKFHRPVAYHLLEDPRGPGELGIRTKSRVRIPAEEIIHIHLPEWVDQGRGVPWMSTALQRAHMLSGYEDAEVVAARAASAKMGFYERSVDAADEFVGDGQDGEGNPIQEFEPGVNEVLPQGWSYNLSNPTHPTTQYGDFVKSMLRGIASGLGVNYNTLANDLEGVNFTSLRQGALTDRDLWMMLQDWIVEVFHERVYREWLTSSLFAGAIVRPDNSPLSATRAQEFQRVVWQPRRWQWVDPLKEVNAQKEAHNLRVRSLSSFIREGGDDPDEVWAEMAAERAKLEALGIPLPEAAGATMIMEVPEDQANAG